MHDRISFGGGVVKDTLVLGVSPQYQHIRNLIVTAGPLLRRHRRRRPTSKCAVVTAAVRQGALWQRRCSRRPDLRDQRHSLHHHRRLQGERGRLRRIGDRRPDHPDSLFRGPLLHRNRTREPDLLLHAQHGRGARRRKRNHAHHPVAPPAQLGLQNANAHGAAGHGRPRSPTR